MPDRRSSDRATRGRVGTFDRRVYNAIAAYAFDEALAHPSQRLIADDLGCTRESVNRAVRRLREAGWLRIVERPWSFRTRWRYNVYELLETFAVSDLTVRRIVRRAHNTTRKRQRRLARRLVERRPRRPDHTNPKGWCSCRFCKTDLATRKRPPPALPTKPTAQMLRDQLRTKYRGVPLPLDRLTASLARP